MCWSRSTPKILLFLSFIAPLLTRNKVREMVPCVHTISIFLNQSSPRTHNTCLNHIKCSNKCGIFSILFLTMSTILQINNRTLQIHNWKLLSSKFCVLLPHICKKSNVLKFRVDSSLFFHSLTRSLARSLCQTTHARSFCLQRGTHIRPIKGEHGKRAATAARDCSMYRWKAVRDSPPFFLHFVTERAMLRQPSNYH